MSALIALLNVTLSIASLLVVVPVTVLFIEVVCGLKAEKLDRADQGERARLAILMPAHNESLVIARAIRSIIPQLQPHDRLLVVADNCSDDTADIAASEGCEVIRRSDSTLRGKGFALDYGVRHLQQDAPDIVIIIDADCIVSAEAINRIAHLCSRTTRPIQALYLMHAPPGSKLKIRFAEFAWIIKNKVRPAGLKCLGMPCQLMGTGMAFPWEHLVSAKLATGHIVEDLKLGIDLALAGVPPVYCPNALVTSEFPTSESGVDGQRTRWEHGHLSVILSDAVHVAFVSLRRFDPKLLMMALDLGVPPLALLALLAGFFWFVDALFFATSHERLPFVISSVAIGLFASSVLMAWKQYGKGIISLREFGFAGIYALIKIPLYVKFLFARQLDWVRSKRDGEQQ